MSHSGIIHYSPTAKYSLGYRTEYFKHEPAYAHSFTVNNLLKRINSPNYQANLYTKSGIGLIHDSSEIAPLLFSGLSADIENRRLYASYSNRFLWGGDVFSQINNRFRFGLAPYVADYGSLHSWFMVQLDHNPINDRKFAVTPFVRFFKSNYLLEVGYGFTEDGEGNLLANFTISL